MPETSHLAPPIVVNRGFAWLHRPQLLHYPCIITINFKVDVCLKTVYHGFFFNHCQLCIIRAPTVIGIQANNIYILSALSVKSFYRIFIKLVGYFCQNNI